MRTIITGCVLAVFSFGFAVADDFFFSATKVEKKDDKWVVTGKKGGKKKDADAKDETFTIDGKVKVFKSGKGNFDKDTKKFTFEAGDAIEAGFKDEAFKEVSAEKPVNLYLTTEGDKVTRVLVVQPFKKKKKDDAK
jgi:hypothetical protein